MIQAQAQEVEMATGLRSSGKIYVVVIVISVIFVGLFFYLFSIDRRLKKLEKED
jgi:CcmD family protein